MENSSRPPHESRSRRPERIVDNTDAAQLTGDRRNYVSSWLRQSNPLPAHTPDSEKNQECSAAKGGRVRKRPRSLSDVSESPEAKPIPAKASFEKRPRHKTREDKYDYKDRPVSKTKPPREQKFNNTKGRRRDEQERHPPLPSTKVNSRGKQAKIGTRQGGGPPQRGTERSPDPEANTSRSRRSRNQKDHGAGFDRDLQEIANFFKHRTDEGHLRVACRRQSRTLDEEDGLSMYPTSHNSRAEVEELQQRTPWYSGASNEETGPKQTSTAHSSTHSTAWSTRRDSRTSATWHGECSDHEYDRPKQGRRDQNGGSISNEGVERQIEYSKRRERPQRVASGGQYRENPTQIPHPPSHIPYRRGKEDILLRTYDNPYLYNQQLLLDDPRAVNGWNHRPLVCQVPRSNEWVPIHAGNRYSFLGYGHEQNQVLPERRSFGHEARLSQPDMYYLPHAFEGGRLLRSRSAFDIPRYSIDQNLTRPTGYGHPSIEHGHIVSNLPTVANLYPLWETEDHIEVRHNLQPSKAEPAPYHSTGLTENPHKQLERKKREEFVKRLEQETFAPLELRPDANYLDDWGPGDVSIQPRQLLSRNETGDLPIRQPSLEGGVEELALNRAPLPYLSASLLSPTHGFVPLPPPTASGSQTHQLQGEGRLSTIWQRHSEV